MIKDFIITENDCKRYSLEMLAAIEREKIVSIDDLKKKDGRAIKIDRSSSILFEEGRPSGRTLVPTDLASTLSYVVKGIGIPIEIRFNQRSDYCNITIKGDFLRKGYSPYLCDTFGNRIQSKRIKGYSFDIAIKELEELAR